MFQYVLLSLISVLLLPQDVTKAQREDQPGFISIDCGLQKQNYTDQYSGDLFYQSDAGLIDTGVSENVATVYLSNNNLIAQFSTVRYFPEGSRNCYTLRPVQGKDGRYLIRARFMYGNYDGKNQPPKFDLYIGVQYWDTVKIENASTIHRFEIMHTPLSDHVNVCLVKTGPGIPFISALELRPLSPTMYVTGEPRGSLNYLYRWNINGSSNSLVRFKDDIYDRIWLAGTLDDTLPLSTPFTVNGDILNEPPSLVMSTAVTPTNTSNGRLGFSWSAANISVKYYVFLYFAEVVLLGANESRTFDIFLNGNSVDTITPKYLEAGSVRTTSAVSGNTTYEIEMVKTAESTLFPILNAVEIYTLVQFFLQETHEEDVAAILNIKTAYNLTQNWQGDPCGPQGFQWTGVNCSANNNLDNPRITSLNLSYKKLVGVIAPAIFELKALEKLDLSNNNLTGTVPVFLAELDSLRELNLKGDQFSKPFPQQLLNKANSGTLKFDYDSGGEEGSVGGGGGAGGGSGDVCLSGTCNKKKNNIVVPIAASIGGVLFVLGASLTVFFITRSLKPKDSVDGIKAKNTADQDNMFIVEPNITPFSQRGNGTPMMKYSPSENNDHKIIAGKSRQFSYHEVLQITNNFHRVIGKGGFGTVYHGYVGDIQVAVKMLSPTSTQGYKEFQAEATLLLTIHHKNLASLVGYCYEGSNMGILYEYMANGNMEKHLFGNSPYVLAWEERLKMATDAAQGLEYLHHGCKPPIVHRDVKITNILIDEKFGAKLADFGLSRAFSMEDATHISTVVAGTPGYLDPEYYSTTRLTEKSDVYSFGIVLLEIVTGRPALPRNNEMTHITTWVSAELENGDLSNVVDPKLRGDYVVNSVWKVLDVAMSCVARNSTRRPTMSFVVMELKTCLTMESTRHETGSKDSIGTISSNMDTGLNPQAR